MVLEELLVTPKEITEFTLNTIKSKFQPKLKVFNEENTFREIGFRGLDIWDLSFELEDKFCIDFSKEFGLPISLDSKISDIINCVDLILVVKGKNI